MRRVSECQSVAEPLQVLCDVPAGAGIACSSDQAQARKVAAEGEDAPKEKGDDKKDRHQSRTEESGKEGQEGGLERQKEIIAASCCVF